MKNYKTKIFIFLLIAFNFYNLIYLGSKLQFMSKEQFKKNIEIKNIKEEDKELSILNFERIYNNSNNENDDSYYLYKLYYRVGFFDTVEYKLKLKTKELNNYTKIKGKVITENIYVKNGRKNTINNFLSFYSNDLNMKNSYFVSNNLISEENSKNIDYIYEKYENEIKSTVSFFKFIIFLILIVVDILTIAIVHLTTNNENNIN